MEINIIPDEQQKAKEDLTGREQMAWNVLAGWAGQLIFVIAGFIMPRMIDHHAGQVALGIWDFSWSLISYFGLAGLGVGSSVNRYVAKYRAVNDVTGLRKTVSSVLAVELAAAFFVLIGTAAAVQLLPIFFGQRLGSETEPARWVVGFLGLSVVVQMIIDVFRGVMTGCHRWDLYNGLNAGFYLLTVVGMILTLLAGQGVKGLAVVYFGGVVLTEVVRVLLAFRVCPELKIGLRFVHLKEAREMISFGLKRVMAGVPSIIVFQGTSLLIANQLGPAALAVFSRPAALVRNAEMFINKFALVLTPTAGSLQSSGRSEDLRELLIETTRVAVYLALPMVLFLALMGDPILWLWMGSRYEHGMVLAILSAGLFLPMIQQSVMSILIGMNYHGQVGFISLIVTVSSFGLSIFVVGIRGWSMEAAALAVALPMTLGLGLVVLVSGCLKLNIPFGQFSVRVFGGPILCAVPFALCLLGCRELFKGKPIMILISGVLSAAGVLGPLYWHFVVPLKWRNKVLGFVKRRKGGIMVYTRKPSPPVK